MENGKMAKGKWQMDWRVCNSSAASSSEIAELRLAGFNVRAGNNAIRPDIAAVSARIENGTLRILKGACPNLLAEAELYRYSEAAPDRRAEAPVDDNNHALAALRYLISKLDARSMAQFRPEKPAEETEKVNSRRPCWDDDDEDEAGWIRLW